MKRKYPSAVDEAIPSHLNDTPSVEADRARRLRRYHELVDLKMAGMAGPAEGEELAQLTRELDGRAHPSEFGDAILALRKDRHALLDSMKQIEGFLARSSAKPRP